MDPAPTDPAPKDKPVGGAPQAQFADMLSMATRAPVAAAETTRLLAEWAKIALGMSDVEVPARDTAYGDPMWSGHPLFRQLAQGHLAWAEAVERTVGQSAPEGPQRERALHFSNLLTGALSPANFLHTNPAAIKKAIDTGGMSVLRGAANFARDVADNRGMPRLTDATPFTVGENLACTPGAVVHREEMFELIQYAPATATVAERPLLVVPPQVGRYYILDLAPGRSLVEHAVAEGNTVFMLVWRNPRTEPGSGHGAWGIEAYMSALIRAFDVVMEVAGTENLNLLGFCAGGMTGILTQAHLQAATGRNPVHSATYLVTMIDTRQPNMVATLSTSTVSAALDAQAGQAAVIDAKTIAHTFAWMRPKDLVHGPAINSWLLGEDPSSYDLLAWNDDAANMPSAFVRDTIALMASGALTTPGGATLLGTPIDLSKVTTDSYVVSAQTDHITTWRPVYMTSQLLGGDSEVVLVNKGHIQTIVSPVAKSRQKFWAGPAVGPDADAWRAQTPQQDGSWWPHWSRWLAARSGADQPAPTGLGGLGGLEHAPIEPAPGSYVHEK